MSYDRRGVTAGLGAVIGGALAAGPGRAAAPAAGGRPRVRLHTAKGDIVVELDARRAPLSAANFLHYVEAGKYDGASFFRATRPPGYPAEGTIVAATAPGVRPFAAVAHESTAQTGLRHRAGVISLGRFAPGTATSDVFICLADSPGYDADPRRPGDNLGFAAFGQVTEGMAVVRRIHAGRADGRSPYPDQKGQWLNPPVAILTARRVG